MENTKSVKSIKKDDQIVKLNKKKIIIISLIVIIFIVGLSVGLYFAFRPEKTPLVRNDHTHWVDVDKAKKSIKDTKSDNEDDPNIVGLYFGIENSDLSDLALYGDTALNNDEKEDLSGPFSEYLKWNDEMEWYCINAENETENEKNMKEFFHGGEENYSWTIENDWSSTNYGGEASNASIDFDSQTNEWVSADIQFKLNEESSDWDDIDSYTLDFVAGGESITFDYTAPTWMWFRNGELYAVSNGILHEEDEEGGVSLPGESSENGITIDYWKDMSDNTYDKKIVLEP